MHVSLYFLTLLKSHLQKGNNNVYFLGVFRRLNAVISVLTQKHWINQLLPDWNWACGETDSFLATQIPFITLWISNTFICIGLSRSTWHEGKASCGRCRGDESGQPLLLRVSPSGSLPAGPHWVTGAESPAWSPRLSAWSVLLCHTAAVSSVLLSDSCFSLCLQSLYTPPLFGTQCISQWLEVRMLFWMQLEVPEVFGADMIWFIFKKISLAAM